MNSRLSSFQIMTGIFILSLLLIFSSAAFSREKPLRYSFGIFTRGFNYTDQLFITGQNQQPFANREAAFYFEGDLYLCQVAVEGSTHFFSVVIAASRYEVTGAGGDHFSDTAGISQPFFISWNKGKIERLWLHRTASASVSSSVRMLMGYLQYQQPQYGTSTVETTEDDLNGHCLTRYTFYPMKNDMDSAVKEKRYYVQQKDEFDFNELKTTYTPESNIQMLIKKGNLLPLMIEGRDKVVTRLSQKMIGESETKFWMHNKAITKDALVAAQLSKKIDTGDNYIRSSIYIYTSSKDFRRNIRKDILGQDSLALLVAKLHSSFAEDETDSMVLKLKSLATVYPGMAYPLAAMLDTAAPRGTLYKIISTALLDTETDNAVNALSALAWKHRDDWDYAKGLITNTGLNAQVTDSAIAFFKSLALYKPLSKTSRAAWMGLGTMTDNIFKLDSTAGEALWRWICDSLVILEAYDGASRVKLLVWGNSNQSAAMDSVLPFIKSDNEELRSVAVVCTGLFSSARKIPFLLEVIKKDTVMSIRNNAARALSGQLASAEHLLDLKTMLVAENDSSIRQALLAAIDIKGKEKIMVQEILQQAEKNDASLSVRQLAGDMLRRMED